LIFWPKSLSTGGENEDGEEGEEEGEPEENER